jgi:uncharacterized protein (TIGR03067 family)
MRTLLPAVLIVTCTCTVWADEEKPKGDLGKLQGTWKGTVGANNEIPITIKIEGMAITATFTNDEGKEMVLKGEVKVDEKATPKAVDFVKFTDPDGKDLPDNLGIYELKDDEWKVCSGGQDNPRPTEFKEGGEGGPHLLVLKREKPAKS